MAFLQRFIPTFIFCVLSLSIFSQNAPSPNGGPLQNPRPNNANADGGGGTIPCPYTHPAVVPEFIFAYIDIESSTPTYTLPGDIPPFYLSIDFLHSYYNIDSNLYISEGINVFTISKYQCKADPSEFYYYVAFEVPIDLLEEQMQSILAQMCLDNLNFDGLITGRLQFTLTTYDEEETLIEYPIENHPELFGCDYPSIGNESQITSELSNIFRYCCEVGNNVLSFPFLPEAGNQEVKNRTSTESKQYKITPNPFLNHLIIDEQIQELRILNSSGEIVFDHKGTCNSINTELWTPGIFIIQSYDGTSWKSEKFIKAE